ncbi:MAG: helix-turn-helix domain-containing protein, partial [Anaerolineae bacterium]
MSALGEMLRRAREEKGISLDQAHAETRIRKKFLQALEEGDYEALPEEVFVRGFVRAYAAYLGLDAQKALALYFKEKAPEEAEIALASSPAPSGSVQAGARLPPWPAHWLSPAWAIFIGLIACAVGFLLMTGVWIARRYFPAVLETPTPEATPTPYPTFTPLPPSPTPTPTVTATPTITPTPTPKIYTGVEIQLIVYDKAWLQVIVDGVKEFEGILEAGERRTWNGKERVAVRCGNAGGVEVLVNGESIGRLGQPGQVVDLEWLKEEATPPPAPSPTPTG